MQIHTNEESRLPRRVVLRAALALALFARGAAAEPDPNLCDEPGDYPDVVVAEIHQTGAWGTVDDVAAFSIGTRSCNVGTCWLDWIAETPAHPVIAQNLFRLKDGRFEQLGQSWLKHAFFAESGTFCSAACLGDPQGDHLGVQCSDPYSVGVNGNQIQLGPKFEVNAATAEFPFPFTAAGQSGGPLYKRLQARLADLDPLLNPGARYFVEAHYVTADDAAAGRAGNNASYREVHVIQGAQSAYSLQFASPTVVGDPAIEAWSAADAGVLLQSEELIGDGVFRVGSRATHLGGGVWAYEYAVHNLNSHRGVRSFRVELPYAANVSAVGFHDVDYHSGEPFDGADWSGEASALALSWSTASYQENPDANALRWGTLYNFRFQADVPPVTGSVRLGLFRPGSPGELAMTALVPRVCDGDGLCDPGEDCANCAADCAGQGGGGGCCGDGTCDAGETPCGCFADCGPGETEEFVCGDGADGDCDARADCADADCCSDAICTGPDADEDGFALCDCDDANPDVWASPGEVEALALVEEPGMGTALGWSAPLEPGATSWSYAVLRSANPRNFETSTLCLPLADASLPEAQDTALPPPGGLFCYLVRAVSGCPAPADLGSLGRDSAGRPRAGRGC